MSKREGAPRGGKKQAAKRKRDHATGRRAPEAEHIELIARGCLVHGSRVLLCRNLKRGYLYLPGGHIEFGESAAAALRREFLEECGMTVRVGPLALLSEGVFDSGTREHHEINLVFHVEHGGGVREKASRDGRPPVIRSQEKGIGFEWIELAAVPETDIRPLAAKAWLAAMGGNEVPALDWVTEIA